MVSTLLRWLGRKRPGQPLVVTVPDGTTFAHKGASPMTVIFTVEEEGHANDSLD